MPAGTISQSIQPSQKAVIAYAAGATIATEYRSKSSFIVLGRTPTNPGAVEAAAAGAIVAVYLDMSLYDSAGTYHSYMYSAIGGTPVLAAYGSGGTSYGPPVNWLALSTAQIRTKIDLTIRKIKNDLPHINCIFADDAGPGWTGYDSLSAGVREQFYQVHIVIAQKLRELADELSILIFSNGLWEGNAKNQGYPVRATHGCSLYDGFCIEHHATSELAFWLAVGDGQWKMRDPNGQRLMFFIANNASEYAGYRNQRNIAWINTQTTPQYTSNPITSSGLPAHDLVLTFGAAPTVTVSVAPNPVTVQTGTTQQFTATVTGATANIAWRVNGVTGGSPTTGTISAGGLYTAPVSVPSGGAVTVTALQQPTGQTGNSNVTVTASPPPPSDPQLPPVPTPNNRKFGNDFNALIPNNMTPGYVRGPIADVNEVAIMKGMWFGYDGNAGGTAPQPVKLYVFQTDINGDGAARVAATAEFTITAGTAPTWVYLPFTSSYQGVAGSYYLAIHSGGTEATGRFFRNENANVSRGKNAAYPGPPADLASASVGNADVSIFVDYDPVGAVSSSATLNSVGTSTTTFGATQGAVIIPNNLVVYVPTEVVRQVAIPWKIVSTTDGTLEARVTWDPTAPGWRYL